MGCHYFALSQIEPQNKSEHGYRVKASKSDFAALQGMSFYKLVLHPKGIRNPHWHANADELGYCLKGKVLISLFANENTKETFLVAEGEAFFIPSGSLHSIENICEENAELILQFSHEQTEDFELTSTVDMFSNAVLGNTWSVSSAYFEKLTRPIPVDIIGKVKKSTLVHDEERYSSKYKFALETSLPVIATQEGNAKLARSQNWPILHKQALYSLTLKGQGMREPHWHPETAELGYIKNGKGRMSILSPSGKIDTYEINKGDIYFIPKAYPHHIENLKDSDLHIMIFFDQAMPQDIGFSGSIKSFSDETLSAAFHTPKEFFAGLPVYYEDLFIVKKKNALD